MRKLNMGILKRVTAVTLAAAMVFNYGVSLAYASSGIISTKDNGVGELNVVVNPTQIVDMLIQNKGSSISYTPMNEEVEELLYGKVVVESERIGQSDVLVAVSVNDLPEDISYEEKGPLLRDTVASSIRNIDVYAENASGDSVSVNVLMNEGDQWNVANADASILTEGDVQNSDVIVPAEEEISSTANPSEEEQTDVLQPVITTDPTAAPEKPVISDAATGGAITSEPAIAEPEEPSVAPVPDKTPIPDKTPAPKVIQIPEISEESNVELDLSYIGDHLLSVVNMNLRNSASGAVSMNVTFSGGTAALRLEGQLPVTITAQDENGNKLSGVEYSIFKTDKLEYNDQYRQYTNLFSKISEWKDDAVGYLNLDNFSQNDTYCIMQVAPNGYKTPDDFIATFRVQKSGKSNQITDLTMMQSEYIDGNVISVDLQESTAEKIQITVTNGIKGDSYQYVSVENSDGLTARINGSPVFCYNKGLQYPASGSRYVQTVYSSDVESNTEIQTKIRKVLFSGYPFNDALLSQPSDNFTDQEVILLLNQYNSKFEQDCQKIQFSMLNSNDYRGLDVKKSKEIFDYMLDLHQSKNYDPSAMESAAKAKYPEKEYAGFITKCRKLQDTKHNDSFRQHTVGLNIQLTSVIGIILDSHLGRINPSQIVRLFGGKGSLISDENLLKATSHAVWKTLGETFDENSAMKDLSDKIITHANTLDDSFGRDAATFTLPEGHKIQFNPVGENDYVTDPIAITVTNSPGYYYIEAPEGITVYDNLGVQITSNTKIANDSSFVLKMNGNKVLDQQIKITTDGYQIPDEVNFYKPVGILTSNGGSVYRANQNMIGYTIIKTEEPGEVFSYTFGTRPVIPPTEPPVEPTPPTKPTEPPVEPTPPTKPTEPPVEPTPPTKPTEPPVESTPPTESTEPPMESTPPVEPTEPVVPTPSTEPTEPVVPTPSTEPTEPVIPTPPAESTEPTPSVEPTQTPEPTLIPDTNLPEPTTPSAGSGFYPPSDPVTPSTPEETPVQSPTPSSDPIDVVEIPDEEVPLSGNLEEPEEPEEQEFDIPDMRIPLSIYQKNGIDIADDEIPLAAADPVTIEDEEVPLGAADPGVEIPDEEVPLGLLPQTGGSPLSLLSIFGICIVIVGLCMRFRRADE